MKASAEIKTITVPFARRILKSKNPSNRAVNKKHVTYLADQIKKDQWCINGETIIFDSKGNLTDGQHRLHAVIEADKPIKSWVISGVGDGAKETTDTGNNRNTGDIFSLNAEAYHAKKASLAGCYQRFVDREYHWSTGGKSKLVNNDLYNIYSNEKDDMDIAVRATSQKVWSGFNSGCATFAAFLISKFYGEHTLELFMTMMREGGDYSKSPTHTMPLWIKERKFIDTKKHRREQFYVIMWCFERWIEKKPTIRINVVKILENAESLYDKYKLQDHNEIN